ncbi:MAG: hypothetical protein ACOCV7_04255 [Desulfonatronovibrionaceae bacterium]
MSSQQRGKSKQFWKEVLWIVPGRILRQIPSSSLSGLHPALKKKQPGIIIRAMLVLLLIFSSYTGPAAYAQNWTPACDNLEIDPARLKQAQTAGHSLDEYRFGAVSSSGALYISQILNQDAPRFNLEVPEDAGLYGREAGSSIPYTLLVCYPSATDNPHPDYAVPGTDLVIPAMRPGNGKYYFSHDQPFPLVVISHGLLMDPLDKRIFELARSGYVAAALFHGDGRFPFPSLLDLTRIEQFSLRPLAISRTIDYMLKNHPAREIIDPVRIGGVGASIGGLAMFSLTGAWIIGPDHWSTRQTALDPRISAAAGIVPYMGTRGIPFPVLGISAQGARQAHIPYMAVSSLFDPVADIQAVERALNQKPGDAFLVSLDSHKHYLSDPAIDLSFKWILAFMDTYLQAKPDNEYLLTPGNSLESSVGNSLTLARTDSLSYINETFDAVEALVPDLLPPATTQELDEILFRSYPGHNYLAVYSHELYWISQSRAAPLGPLMYWWSMLARSG